MKAICPKNEKHKKFITAVHVKEEWIVDESGNFIKKYGNGVIEVIDSPLQGNTLVFCYDCGSTAILEN